MSKHFIKLLPDTVANQIAAGEVVQRPASVVKELMENAIDSGADHIQLFVKEAGKLLVQVIDNGCGMNEVDARMCLERHATSKISSSDDLFKIRTMGFRGEAMASIASVSQLELKTRTHEQQLGTLLLVEGSQVMKQEQCQCPAGTSISVKNLFYNVPARRNFLKSNTMEMKHIYDEFHRIAISYPHIKFSFFENNTNRFQLEKGNLKQRIIQIFGASYQKKIVGVDQQTDYLSVKGFIVKPEFAKKSRGEQYFFVNNRFIKSFFLHRVVANTYRPYIQNDYHPGYFLFIDVAPEEIDINVHPTKTEIKFKHDFNVANILESSVKYAIGSFNIAPSIDFEVEQSIELPFHDPNRPLKMPGISINPEYNPFKNTTTNQKDKLHFTDLIDKKTPQQSDFQTSKSQMDSQLNETEEKSTHHFLSAGGRYIIAAIKNGVMIVDTLFAKERIVYERTLGALNEAKTCSSQQLLFPETIELPPAESDILIEIIPELDSIGFNISHLGKGSFSCSASPADWDDTISILPFIENVIESYQHHLLDAKQEKNKSLAMAISKKLAVKPPKLLTQEEMNAFIDLLFAQPMPNLSPSGNKTLWIIEYNEISKQLSKS
jgi:DNA mismatch repair protein MutL